MSFKTLAIKHLPDGTYDITVDGVHRIAPDQRTLNAIIAEVDGVEIDEENIL